MRRRLTGAFTTASFGDFQGAPGGAANWAARTPGAGVINRLQPPPTGQQKWEILSVSIRASLAFLNTTPGGVYGKLGKILAGFVVDAGDFPSQVLTQYPQFPTDPALVDALWDPDVHPMPPSVAAVPPTIAQMATLLPVSVTVTVPVPIDMTPQYTPLLGIWLNPSLYGASSASGFVGLDVENLNYSLMYDDGQ